MQNFDNISVIEEQCSHKNMTVVHIEYLETNCEFPSLYCEQLKQHLPRAQRFELYEGGSSLQSFYCVDDCYLLNTHTWVALNWSEPCELQLKNSSDPTNLSYDNNHFKIQHYSKVENISLHWTCPILVQDTLPPIILLIGDSSWELVPDWLKVVLRVTNGIALASLVVCLVTFAVFRELRNAYGQIALSLVIALMASLVFRSGYFTLEFENVDVCVFIGTLLYYLVVVPGYWWTAIAIFLAWTLGRRGIHRVENSGTKLFLLLSLFGWGVPFILTILMLVIHVSGVQVFDIHEHCWISSGWPVYAVTIETLVPFILDCILFCLVIFRLRKTRHELKTQTETRYPHRDDRRLTIKVNDV